MLALPRQQPESAPMQTEQIHVKGMTCGGCVKNVSHALRTVVGVGAVTVSLEEGEATVQYDESVTSPARLRTAVSDAGYEVDAAPAPWDRQ